MTNKEIKFAFTVDDRSVQQAKRALTEILSLTERIARSMSGAGGTAGRGPPMTFLGGMNVGGGRPGGGPAAVGGSNQANNVFTVQAKGLKDLSRASGDTAKTMAQDLRKSIEDQKRSLADLDAALETASKRYKELKNNQSSLVSSMMAQGATPAQAQAYTSGQLQSQQDYIDNTRHQRRGVDEQLKESEKRTKEFYHRDDVVSEGVPEGPGSTRLQKLQRVLAGVTGVGVLGAAVGQGVFMSNELDLQTRARTAQAFGSHGVRTLAGDYSSVAATLMLARTGNADAENFMDLSTSRSAQKAINAADAAGKVSLNPATWVAAGTSAVQGAWSVDAQLQERMAAQLELKKASEPEWFHNFNKLQGEAPMRLAMMRRMGIGSKGVSAVLGTWDGGEAGAAFEATRPGGMGFAQKNWWRAASAGRQGLNVSDIGAVLAATATTSSATGSGANELLRSLRVGLDPAAVETLAKAVAAGVNSGLFGATSGMGLLETLRFDMGGMTQEEQTRTMGQRVASLKRTAENYAGYDGMGQAINVLSSVAAAGPHSDIFTTRALQMLSPGDLAEAASGRITPAMRDAGITPENAKAALGVFDANNVARYVPQSDETVLNANSKRGRSLAVDFGGNAKKMWASLSAHDRSRYALGMGGEGEEMRRQMGGYYVGIGATSTVDEGMAYFDFQRGIGEGKVVDGKFVGGNGASKTREGLYDAGSRKTAEESFRQFLDKDDGFVATVVAAAPKMAETFLNMGKVGVNAGKAAIALQKMTDAAMNFANKYGKPPTRSAKDQSRLATDAQNTAKVNAATDRLNPVNTPNGVTDQDGN